MKSLIVLILFQIASNALAAGFDPLAVYDYPECKGTKSQLSRERLQYFKNSNEFLRPGDPLNLFSKRLQSLNQKKPGGVCRLEDNQHLFSKKTLPLEAQRIFNQFQSNLVQQVSQDVEAQKNIMELGLDCTRAARSILSQNEKITDLKRERYQKILPAPVAEKCEEFSKTTLVELQQRMEDLRIVMAVAFSEKELNQKSPLKHPKPMLEKIIQLVFPTVWKKDSLKQLKPLNETELKRANSYLAELKKIKETENFAANPRQIAEDTYFQLLAETPMMLYLDQKMSARDLENAFSNMIAQNQIDLEDFKKNPNQDLVLKTPYVREALRKIPESDRGDACLMVSEVFNNLKIQYESYPTYIGRLSLLLPVFRGLQAVSLAKGFAQFSTNAGYAYGASQAAVGLGTFQRYSRVTELCHSTAIQDASEQKKLCRFKEANDSIQSVETNIKSSLLAMTVLGTLGRLIGR